MAPRVKEICDYGRCRESVRGHVRGRVSGCECCGNVPAQGSLRIPPGRAAPAGGPSALSPSQIHISVTVETVSNYSWHERYHTFWPSYGCCFPLVRGPLWFVAYI